MKLISKVGGLLRNLSGKKPGNSLVKIDIYQEAINKIGAEQLKRLVSKGLRVPVVAL